MAKNLVNKDKFKVILELYSNSQITFDQACLLLEDSVETIIWSYAPIDKTSSFTSINSNEYGEDQTNEA
jgi:hypothetical protein